MATMLYKAGGEAKINNLWPCDTIVAHDDEEQAELLAQGWHLSPLDACVPEKERAKVLADIVKKSERLAAANAREMAFQGLDPTGSFRIDGA